MNTTKKLLTVIFTVTAVFIGGSAFAQSTPKSAWRFGVGGEALVPLGNLHTYSSNFGLGITPRLQYGIADNPGAYLYIGVLPLLS